MRRLTHLMMKGDKMSAEERWLEELKEYPLEELTRRLVEWGDDTESVIYSGLMSEAARRLTEITEVLVPFTRVVVETYEAALQGAVDLFTPINEYIKAHPEMLEKLR